MIDLYSSPMPGLAYLGEARECCSRISYPEKLLLKVFTGADLLEVKKQMNSTNPSLPQNILQNFQSHIKDSAVCILVFFALISFLQPLNILSKDQHGNRRVSVRILLLTPTVMLLWGCGLVEKAAPHIHIHPPCHRLPFTTLSCKVILSPSIKQKHSFLAISQAMQGRNT